MVLAAALATAALVSAQRSPDARPTRRAISAPAAQVLLCSQSS